MFVAVGIAKRFKDFEDVGFSEALVGKPSHCGELALQGWVSAEFGAKGVVGNIQHGGKFFGRIEHAEGFLRDLGVVEGFHGTFRNFKSLRKIRDLMRNNSGFGTFLNDFGTFRNDFKLGANLAGIFSICKGIFSYCNGKFSVKTALAQTRKKIFKFLKQG